MKMRFWSKGLGSRGHIIIPCGSEKVEVSPDGKELILSGRTLPPVEWNYTITMNGDDFLAILELGLGEKFVKFLLQPRRFRYAIKLLFLLLTMIVRYIFTSPLSAKTAVEGLAQPVEAGTPGSKGVQNEGKI